MQVGSFTCHEIEAEDNNNDEGKWPKFQEDIPRRSTTFAQIGFYARCPEGRPRLKMGRVSFFYLHRSRK